MQTNKDEFEDGIVIAAYMVAGIILISMIISVFIGGWGVLSPF